MVSNDFYCGINISNKLYVDAKWIDVASESIGTHPSYELQEVFKYLMF